MKNSLMNGKSCPEDQKKKFKDIAEIDKKRYDTDMEEYKALQEVESKVKSGKKDRAQKG